MHSTNIKIEDIISKARIHFYPSVDEMTPEEKENLETRRVLENSFIHQMVVEEKRYSKTLPSNVRILEGSTTYKSMPLKRRSNPILAIAAAVLDFSNFKHIPLSLTKNRDFVKFVLDINGLGINYFPKEVKSDFELCYIALSNTYGEAIRYVDDSLKNNMHLVEFAIQLNGSNYQYLSETMQDNLDIALKAVTQNGFAFQYLLPKFQGNKDIVKVAVNQDHSVLFSVSDKFQDDEDIVDLVMPEPYKKSLSSSLHLSNASPRLQRSPKFLLASFKGKPLETSSFIQKQLKDDPEIIRGFLDALDKLDKEDPIHSIYRILKVLDVNKSDPIENPNSITPLNKNTGRCVDWLVQRLKFPDIDSELYYHPFIKEKITEEVARRALLNVQHKPKDKQKPSRKMLP